MDWNGSLIPIEDAVTAAASRIYIKELAREDRKIVQHCLNCPAVAEKLLDWRDPDTGNNILHHICFVNDAELARLAVDKCGVSLVSSVNFNNEPPIVCINGLYKPKSAIALVKLFKQYNADLNPLKNVIINDVLKTDWKLGYSSVFVIEALKILTKSKVITEEDVAKFDEAAKYVIDTFCFDYNQYKQEHIPCLNRKFADCYAVVMSEQEYKYDPSYWTNLKDRRLMVITSSLPNFVWCLLDRRLGENEARLVLQYCAKLTKSLKANQLSVRNVIKQLVKPIILKFPRMALSELPNLSPKCLYQFIELDNILSYPLSDGVATYILEYADRKQYKTHHVFSELTFLLDSIWAPYRNRWNRLSQVTPIFSIENLPDELIAIILSYTTPRIAEMFAILNKNMNRMYLRNKAAIWRLKFEKEMPYILEPDLTGKSYREQVKKLKYKYLSNINSNYEKISSCEAYQQYFIFTTANSRSYCLRSDETQQAVFRIHPLPYANARIFNDTIYLRGPKECQFISLAENETRGSIAISASTHNLAFAVDKNYIACQDGFFDVVSGYKLSNSFKADADFNSCALRDGLCFEETKTAINILDPRVKQHQAAKCTFDSKLHTTVKYNMTGHTLIVAGDKIDIFDTRDLTRPIMSSPYLDSAVKLIDLTGMRAFTSILTWNLRDMTYIYQNKPYHFSSSKMVVTNGVEVFSHKHEWWNHRVDIEHAWNGSYSPYGDFMAASYRSLYA